MKRAIIVTLAAVLCLLLFSGCSRKTTEAYAEHKRNEYRSSVVVDSAFMARYLAEIRNTTTSRVDSVVIKDSVIIRELPDGSRETYRERNTEKVGNYVQVSEMAKVIEELEKKMESSHDTTMIEVKDTIYINKVKGISPVQRAINYTSIFVIVFSFLGFIICVVKRK